jgi:Cu+-exporting ATPase
MTVTDRSPHSHRHDGQTYYFCGARCRERFAANPGQFLAAPGTAKMAPAAPPAAPVAPAGAVYTCPMHPEIRQDRPGQCPAAWPWAERWPRTTRSCGICAPFRTPDDCGFVLAMFGHRLGGWTCTQSFEMALATPVVL